MPSLFAVAVLAVLPVAPPSPIAYAEDRSAEMKRRRLKGFARKKKR